MTTAMPERRSFDPRDAVRGVTPPGTTTAPYRPGTTTTRPRTQPYDDESANSFIRSLFGDVLGGILQDKAGDYYRDWLEGKPIEQIIFEIRQSPEHAARFPGFKDLEAKGRSINEAAYLDLERTYTQVARNFDLPPGFYDDPSDFGKLIAGEVSPAEWQRRLTSWQAYERETRDPVAMEEYRRQFAAAGLTVSDGDMLALVIDPARSVSAVERRLEAGRIATESVRAGFGQLGTDEALGLADQGVTREDAARGFDALADSRELFAPLPGEPGGALGRQEQLGAAFGTDAGARRRVERIRDRRRAGFSGGGGVAQGRDGLAGLASPV